MFTINNAIFKDYNHAFIVNSKNLFYHHFDLFNLSTNFIIDITVKINWIFEFDFLFIINLYINFHNFIIIQNKG